MLMFSHPPLGALAVSVTLAWSNCLLPSITELKLQRPKLLYEDSC
jgi:hypothetical protein